MESGSISLGSGRTDVCFGSPDLLLEAIMVNLKYMSLREFRNLVKESRNPNWFNNTVVELQYSHLGLDLKFEGFSALYKFLDHQVKLWNEFENQQLPKELQDSKAHFVQLKSQLLNFVQVNKLQESEATLNNLKRNLQSWYWRNYNNFFTADSPEVQFLKRLYTAEPSHFIGAYRYLTGQAPQNLNQISEFSGYLKGYEYASKDSLITKRRTDEKASITQLRNDFLNTLPQLEKQLSDHLVTTNEKALKFADALDHFQMEKEKSVEDWFINAKGEFENYQKEASGKIAELEKTYQEKLELEAPARYWRKKSEKFYREGRNARTILLSIIGFAAVVLVVLLFTSPDWIFNSVFSGNATAILRWSFLFITFLSLIAFAIKAISKVMFSSYHLARDAEERHTLTFFYLALSKESSIKEEERNMIIQALFSRVETGLLKDDSGPAMPNDLTKFLNK